MAREWLNMNPGVSRRAAIVEYLKENGFTYVNRSHCPQTWQDPDIRYMLKKGIVVLKRQTMFSWGSGGKGRYCVSFIVLREG